MLKIYLSKKIDNLPHIPLLDFYWGKSGFSVKRPGDDALKFFNKKFFDLTEDPKEADYFLISHNFFYVKDREYIESFIELSKKHNKKIIVFSYGDSDEDINVPNSIIFRTSQYAHKKKKNELIMPAIADDLTGGGEIDLRNKKGIPIIGFCGWASLSAWSLLKQNIKSIPLTWSPKKKGILFRIKALSVLQKSKLITSNFIIRQTYSGNEKTRQGTLERLREEYIKNIIESDLSLAIKGDGNFSVRFYEILSLGKVPLFVDTDSVLPLEDKINYKDFILKVDYRNIKNISKITEDFYQNISEEDFILMQKKAREIFEKYLRADKYFEYMFLENNISKLN